MGNPVIISFGSGKGGVGKSTLVVNIGTVLSQKGYNVGFIDADLGGANLHTCLGIKRPQTGLQDFLSGKVHDITLTLQDTLIPNSWLLSGASDIMDISNPQYAKKQKLLKSFSKLSADFILIDLGAGSSANTTDFFTEFSNGIIVTDGMPTSIENAYSFLKNSLIRGIIRLFPGRRDLKKFITIHFSSTSDNPFMTIKEFMHLLQSEFPDERKVILQWLKERNIFLILNMVKDNSDLVIIKKFSEVVKKYLNITIHYIGYLIYEDEIRKSIKKMSPFALNKNESQAISCIELLTENIINLTENRESGS